MKSLQKGFTLIELIVVIVILGILAAVALPRFIDLTDEALAAAVQGVSGAVASGAAVNYGGFLANSAKAVQLNQANVCTAGILNGVLTGGTASALLGTTVGGTAYSVTGTGACNGVNAGGTAVSCNVIGTKGAKSSTAVTTVVCTG